jgi:hypothetical protein
MGARRPAEHLHLQCQLLGQRELSVVHLLGESQRKGHLQRCAGQSPRQLRQQRLSARSQTIECAGLD